MTKSVNVVELHSVVTDLLNPSPPVGAEGLEPAAFALTGRDPLAPRESTTCDDTRPHGLAAFSRGAQSGSAMLRLSRRRYLNMLLSDKEEPGANEPRPLRMSRPLLLGGVWVAAAVVVIALFLGDWVRPVAPSRKDCIALWNAPRNAPHREEVIRGGYPRAEIPGTEARLEWRLDVQVGRWGTGFPTPLDRPHSNARVQPIGSLSLA
jgi:hypothetical protein